jgi:tetratricopeptide (TPR) repeat protein
VPIQKISDSSTKQKLFATEKPMNAYKKFFLVFILIVISTTLLHAQDDLMALRSALQIENPVDRAGAIEKFLKEYPTSNFRNQAFFNLFSSYAQSRNDSMALQAAGDYLSTLPTGNIMDAYNDLAYTLAEDSVGLDSANVFAERAEEHARQFNSRHLAMILDTHAYVLYRLGSFQDAEKLQEEAMPGNDNDPTYLFHLALYQAAVGKRIDALNTIAWSLLQELDEESLNKFNEWLAAERPDSLQRSELRTSVVMDAVHRSLDSAQDGMKDLAKSNAAVFMAQMKVDPPTAEKWANEASSSLSSRSSVEEFVTIKRNQAIVLSLANKRAEALDIISSIEPLVDPWQSDFWLLAGNAYEKGGQMKKALTAYETGLLVNPESKLMSAYSSAYEKEFHSTKGMEDKIAELKKSDSDFWPGHFNNSGSSTGRVVLAELFTGAECNPCQAADAGFDALAKYFPRTDLAILEYHVHIPGPDPMTTPDTWDRYRYYNERSGTPTAYFDGGDVIGGGGPRYIARNRFDVYKFDVERQLAIKPAVKLSLNVKSKGDDVLVGLTIESKGDLSRFKNPVLHIALVEKSVHYVGANSITTHRFVVRDLVNGPLGFPLSLDKELSQETRTIDLKKVESAISNYLDNIRTEPSFPLALRDFPGWKARPDKLNRKNLAIVAFVQDMDTKEILQAAYKDIPYGKK